jgi:hypothetical protein
LKASDTIREVEEMEAEDIQNVKSVVEKKGYVGFSVLEIPGPPGTLPQRVAKLKTLAHVGATRPTKADLTPVEEDETVFHLARVGKSSRQWEPLFRELDVRNAGEITWQEVRFLEEQWKSGKGGQAVPVRSDPQANASKVNLGSTAPPLAITPHPLLKHEGLYSSPAARMHKVSDEYKGLGAKAKSLPALSPASTPLRPNWNDRHHVLDTHGNKDIQVIHMVTTVLTQDRERCLMNVARKMKETPTMQWLEEYLSGPRDEEEDEDDETDDEDLLGDEDDD